MSLSAFLQYCTVSLCTVYRKVYRTQIFVWFSEAQTNSATTGCSSANHFWSGILMCHYCLLINFFFYNCFVTGFILISAQQNTQTSLSRDREQTQWYNRFMSGSVVVTYRWHCWQSLYYWSESSIVFSLICNGVSAGALWKQVFWKWNFLNLISEGYIFNYLTEEMGQSKSISKSTVPVYVYFLSLLNVSDSTTLEK